MVPVLHLVSMHRVSLRLFFYCYIFSDTSLIVVDLFKKMLFGPSAILLDPTATLSDHILHAVLFLLHREIADHGRHLPHYFTLFHTYASLGLAAKAQLLKVRGKNKAKKILSA